MRLPGYLIVFILAVLLVTTTPMGTGGGTHQFDLLHPLFAHIHLVNGRVLTHEQMAQASLTPAAPASPGPAIGAGTAAGTPDAALGVSPTSTEQPLILILAKPAGSVVDDERMPPGNEQVPPDPPPL